MTKVLEPILAFIINKFEWFMVAFILFVLIFFGFQIADWNTRELAATQRFNARCEQLGGRVVGHRTCVNSEYIELLIPRSEYYSTGSQP